MFSYIWSDNSHIEQLPEFRPRYVVNLILPVLWLEHCVECAIPFCYKSCKMYVDRGDGRCRRFENGTQLYKNNRNTTFGSTIVFKRWSKLEGAIRTKQVCEIAEISKCERRFNYWAAFIEKPCKWLSWKWHRPSRLFENYFDEVYIPQKMRKAESHSPINGLYVLVYNHESRDIKLHFELKCKGQSLYHTSFILHPGWNEYLLECEEETIEAPCLAQIYVDNDETAKLTFQNLDFVVASQIINKRPASKVKCVAWDLDNTLWAGIIGDDGKDGVRPFDGSVSMIKELDEMGVLQTIVSKNDYEIAWEKIQEMGIADYFLYPAINWGRKSQSLLNIAKELNINIDTFAVIDDSVFERNEISTALPQVRVYDVAEIDTILSRPEFNIQITEESKHRRESYIKESQRKKILASWSGDYTSFLKDCMIQLQLFVPTEAEEQRRCFELIQRSNQYNITKNRRFEDYIRNIVRDDQYKVYAFKVSDKFGAYGIVGFSSFEILDNDYYMRDFVMSCRVAQKAIESAFLSHIVSLLEIGKSIYISIEKTEKNNPIRSELLKLPFLIEEDNDSLLKLKFTKMNNSLTENNVVEVIVL